MSEFCFDTMPPTDVVDGCVEVYAAAFGQAPYFETAEQAQGLRDRLTEYQARDGLLVPVVENEQGRVEAVTLAVLAHPGDWWRDRAAATLGQEATSRWLGERCLEVVHVAVRPEAQRRGYGRTMLRMLRERTDAATGILSCHPQATGAQQLYLADGWHVVAREFRTRPDQLGYWLMATDIA